MSVTRLVLVLFGLAAVYGATIPVETDDNRIVGGVDAVPNQIPYIASLRRQSNGNHFCGSSIIRPRWVLSAAHCTEDFEPEGMFVVVGAILLSDGGARHDVSRIINHPDYSLDLLTADISLVQVVYAFDYNAAVQPILVGTEYVSSAAGVVSGWGLTNHTYDELPDNLQTLPTQIITNAACREAHTTWHELIYDSVICTFTEVGQGICMGDSGGSLVVGNYVVGIPSWVIPCGVGFPDAYARVSSYSDWIFENVDEQE